MNFPTYDIVLRLANNIAMETSKRVTAPEAILLMREHGEDAIKSARPAGVVERDNIEERTRLQRLFAKPVTDRGESLFEVTFGKSDHARLPVRAPGLQAALAAGKPKDVDVDALRAQIRAEIEAEMGAKPGPTGDLFGVELPDPSMLLGEEEPATPSNALDADKYL